MQNSSNIVKILNFLVKDEELFAYFAFLWYNKGHGTFLGSGGKMNKQELLQDYKNQEDKLLLAKVLDKLETLKTRNKIENTDFLNLYEQDLIDKFLKKIKFERYYFFGGAGDAERKILIMYPEKLTEEMTRKNHSKMISVIKIKMPIGMTEQYDHRMYLGGIMKLGVEREKVGDISVKNNSAEILVKNEIQKFLMQNLSSLTRFSSCEIECKNIDELEEIKTQKIEITEIVASLRLDNIVSSLARTSRTKALEILEQERVFLNFKNETKASKQVKVGDIITIRGKGRFEFVEISGNTKKGRYVIKINKYI